MTADDYALRLTGIDTDTTSLQLVIDLGEVVANGSVVNGVPVSGQSTAYDISPGGAGEFTIRQPHRLTYLIYTGGTTGAAKGCMVPHGSLLNLAAGLVAETERTRSERLWSPLPMFHQNLLGNAVATMLLGSSISIASRFSVSGFWPDILRSGARVVTLLGSMATMIADMPDVPEMVPTKGQIRMLHCVPCPPALRATWTERFGVEHPGAQAYGMTECHPITTSRPGDAIPPTCVGRPNSLLDVVVLGEDDELLAPGEVGEISIRPRRPLVMFDGYWRNAEATLKAFSNLWFHTGDLGRFDTDGYLYFVDRKADYLRRRGENISSQELEASFLQHGEIAQACVHAVPSEISEDDVKLTAVLLEGSSLTEEELFEWAKDRVPYFALPRYIEFRDELPMSELGRVLKRQLRTEGRTANTWDREAGLVTWERK